MRWVGTPPCAGPQYAPVLESPCYLGHYLAADEVEAAIREALPRGSHYGQCHEREHAFARLFCDMVPGADKVTFCNSGTEATMYAVRLARATAGRPLIAKFEGGYHGTHDLLAVSFGRPIDTGQFGQKPGKADLQRITDQVETAIRRMKAEQATFFGDAESNRQERRSEQ